MFPIAASSDLFGLVIFIIFAVISAFSKQLGQRGNTEEPSKPVRRVPPRQTEDPIPVPPPMDPSSGDLAEEMRRFLQQTSESRRQKKRMESKPASASHYQRSVSPPPPVTQPVIIEEPSREILKPQEKEADIFQEPASKSFQAETASMDIIRQEMRASREHAELKNIPSAEVTSSGPIFHFDRSLLLSSSNLKQAILLSEILGKPKALQPQ